MNYTHKYLAAGRWKTLPFTHRMANVGSEVIRAITWKQKRPEISQQAFLRSLELLDLTRADEQDFARLKELSRVREVLVDFFNGTNEYQSSEDSLEKYFYFFNYAAQRNK